MNKIVILSLGLLLSSAALATPPSFFTPNLYNCKGTGVDVSYTTSGIDGRPTLTFTFDQSENPSTASGRGKQVTKSQSIFGNIVSVYVGAIPDAKTTYASLVIPRIQLRTVDPEDAVEFNSLYIRTDKRTTVGGPNFAVGLLDDSQVVPVACKAHYVHF